MSAVEGYAINFHLEAIAGWITGRVVEALTNAPLSGARILLSTGNTTVSDPNGLFSFSDIRPGVYTVTAECEGCISQNQTVLVRLGEASDAHFVLRALIEIVDALYQETMTKDMEYEVVFRVKNNGYTQTELMICLSSDDFYIPRTGDVLILDPNTTGNVVFKITPTKRGEGSLSVTLSFGILETTRSYTIRVAEEGLTVKSMLAVVLMAIVVVIAGVIYKFRPRWGRYIKLAVGILEIALAILALLKR